MPPTSLIALIAPELILSAVACVLFLLGCSNKHSARKLAPWLALLSLVAVLGYELSAVVPGGSAMVDAFGALRITKFTQYIETLSAGVGILFVLLSWPTNDDATGNSSLYFGQESGEYFALLLLSIVGIFFVASADNLILLFLAIELASIPTYIMVSISRTQPVAQEAGVKYFFLGAMAAAVMLFGFSYLYGTTGTVSLNEIQRHFAVHPGAMTAYELLAVVMLIVGFAFKMAVVPLHFYAGDVYQGAATPVTALLSYVPKTAGFVALLKLLSVVGGPDYILPHQILKMIWIMAVLTMTIGNVLGLCQHNLKRMLAYSSVAHSGYMLAAVATIGIARDSAVQAVLFYLAAYGVMNAGAFGVLMLLPAREHRDGGSAETMHDLAGTGRQHPGLGLAMAACCFSLIGIPMTVGFLGKFYILAPILHTAQHRFYWLAAVTMLNAAISAGYYLRIVATMFLTAEPQSSHPIRTSNVPSPGHSLLYPWPIATAIVLSAGGALLLGTFIPLTTKLSNHARQASQISTPVAMPLAPVAAMTR